ncbi:hypothetical protein K3495_g2867 [Podosphaera aphanis]|nr:hypothetical protein K3495_g2867 [Podosphaera aphanis]
MRVYLRRISYLSTIYLPVVDQFALFFTKFHRHYRVKATLRTEGSHSSLKKHFKNRNGDLIALNNAVITIRERQERNYQNEMEKQMHKVLPQYRSQLLNLVRCSVSFPALRMPEDQANQAQNYLRMPLTVNWTCSGVFTTQYGLQCWYRLVDVLNANNTIEMRSLDPH